MANYTTELRTICESLAGNQLGAYTQTDEIIEKARTQIFDFDYPIYNPDYKPVLETKIIRHYYTREIGLETYGLWKFKLQTKMQEIMPYFNLLYESADLKYDILHDYFIERVHTGEGTQESTGEENGQKDTTTGGTMSENTTADNTAGGKDVTDYTSTGYDDRNTTLDVDNSGTVHQVRDTSDDRTTETSFSDTPQGSLTGVDNLEYLTTFTKVMDTDKGIDDSDTTTKDTSSQTGSDRNDYNRTDKTTTSFGRTDKNVVGKTGSTTGTGKETTSNTRSGNVNTTDKFVETVKGKMGGKLYPEMIQAYRDTLINIDMMIINELRNLFMLLYY